MYHSFHDLIDIGYRAFTKMIYSIPVLSLLFIFCGVSGIIEHKSPENIASLTTLSTGFITYFEYHALIIIGALCFTLAIWPMEKHIQ